MKSIAIITARGGSKRIPKKNIKDFCGKPIIAYSIEAALKSELFDEVMVSTDNQDIAEISRKYGAEVPFMRSTATSNDFATTADVLLEVLNEYKRKGIMFETALCLYPTAPFVTAERLREAASKFYLIAPDSLMSVVKFGFPPQRAVVIRDGSIAFQSPEYALARSQDLEPLYHDCGQFYFFNVESFNRFHSLVMPHTAAYIVPEEEVQDIDNESDWLIAEAKFKVLHTEE